MNPGARMAIEFLTLGLSVLPDFVAFIKARRAAKRRGEKPPFDTLRAYREAKRLYEHGKEVRDRNKK